MKKLTLIYTLCLLVFNVNSQKATFLEPENIIDYYVGTINDVDYYSERNKSLNIFIRFEDYFKQKGEIKIEKDEKLLKIFVNGNNFYSITQRVNDQKEVEFKINKYDIDLTNIESKTIWTIAKIKANKLKLKFQVKQNLVGIVAFSIKKFVNNGYSFVYDINEQKGSNYDFEIKNIVDYRCSDFVFNSKQIDVIFSNTINYIGAYRAKYRDVLLVKCSNQKVAIQKLDFNQKTTFCKSIKLFKISEEDYLITTNLFSHKGPAIIGNGVIKAKFGFEETKVLKLIFNDKLVNEKIWIKNEFRKIKNKRNFTNSAEQKIVEVLQLKDGNFLFFSESNTAVSDEAFSLSISSSAIGTGMGGMGISSGLNSTGGSSNIMEDIIITKVNLEKNEVIWCNKTQNRLLSPTYLVTYYPNCLNFIYSLTDDKIEIYYGKRLKMHNLSSPESVLKFSCDLTTGLNEITPLVNDKLMLEIPYISSVKKVNDKIESFITYEWEKTNKYSIKKVRIVDVK